MYTNKSMNQKTNVRMLTVTKYFLNVCHCITFGFILFDLYLVTVILILMRVSIVLFNSTYVRIVCIVGNEDDEQKKMSKRMYNWCSRKLSTEF